MNRFNILHSSLTTTEGHLNRRCFSRSRSGYRDNVPRGLAGVMAAGRGETEGGVPNALPELDSLTLGAGADTVSEELSAGGLAVLSAVSADLFCASSSDSGTRGARPSIGKGMA